MWEIGDISLSMYRWKWDSPTETITYLPLGYGRYDGSKTIDCSYDDCTNKITVYFVNCTVTLIKLLHWEEMPKRT